MNTDFTVQNEGSILILYAVSEAAQGWVDEHLPEERQTWGQNGTVVESRYICDIVNGITDDELTIGGAS